jgi:acetyl esterase/lipase
MQLRHLIALALLAGAAPSSLFAQSEIIPLYNGSAPGTQGWTQKEVQFDLVDRRFNPPNEDTLVVNVSRPTLTVFRPAAGKANGTAVIVAPGGGFRVLSYKNEGLRVAQWLADRGITAFVLKYRLHATPVSNAEDVEKGMAQMAKEAGARGTAAPAIAIGPVENGAIADGEAAVNLVRARATEFGIDPARIGIIGFSAGGVVSGGATVHAPAEQRPNFVGIIYSFTPGQIPQGAPPAFMAAAADDTLSTAMPQLFSQWRAAGASAELHIYAKGQHGFGTAKQGLPVDGWLDAFHGWLIQQGFAPAR